MAILVVMGVSGVGKTSVARALSQRLGGVFLDADDFHPAQNKQKMAQGIPLEDADRWGWLDVIRSAIQEVRASSSSPHIAVACSALKERYRQRLVAGIDDVRIVYVYLKAPPEVVRERLAARRGHFMPAGLLDSQFAALEEPAQGAAIVIDARADLDTIVEQVMTALGASA